MCRVRKVSGMAKLVFGMNQSLDGYVDYMEFGPSPTLFRLALIRFGGHLSKGEYDVQTDGRHTNAAAPPPVHR